MSVYVFIYLLINIIILYYCRRMEMMMKIKKRLLVFTRYTCVPVQVHEYQCMYMSVYMTTCTSTVQCMYKYMSVCMYMNTCSVHCLCICLCTCTCTVQCTWVLVLYIVCTCLYVHLGWGKDWCKRFKNGGVVWGSGYENS